MVIPATHRGVSEKGIRWGGRPLRCRSLTKPVNLIGQKH